MLEYIMLLRSIASSADLRSFFDWDSTKGIVFTLVAGVALFIIGYLIKGVWGGMVAILIGLLILLYLKGSITF